MVDIGVNIGLLKFKNPVMVASGTFGYGEEFAELYDLSALGAVVTKGISLKPRRGNPMPRVIETPAGMINAIGLENVGVEAFLAEKLPFLREKGATVIVNLFGETIDDYCELAKRLEGVEGVHAIELNISCPNVKAGGVQFGVEAKDAATLTRAVRRDSSQTLIVKLSPLVSNIAAIARAVEGSGAEAISLINTVPAMAIDAATRKPKLANVVGGLSGPAIKPIALRQVWQVRNAVKVPIIGMGGIMNATDAIEFMIAGASAVQVGTANFVNPTAPMDIIDELKAYAEEHSLGNISELVGTLQV